MFNKKAFTLMELIVYVAISATVLVGIITFSWNIMGTGVKVDISTELTQNARTCMEKFTQGVQAAMDLDTGGSTFDIHPGVLSLDYDLAADDIVIDTYEKQIDVAGNPTTIRKLRLTKGSESPVDITSDQMNVTNFVITNLTRDTDAQNVTMQLTLEYINVDNHYPWNNTITIETSATIRER